MRNGQQSQRVFSWRLVSSENVTNDKALGFHAHILVSQKKNIKTKFQSSLVEHILCVCQIPCIIHHLWSTGQHDSVDRDAFSSQTSLCVR